MLMPHKPTANVSIVCANYNNGRYLDDFIRSVAESTMHPAELIIVDDGSTDNSRSVLESFSHLPFLRIIAFPENKGFTAALNAGLEAATGKYIMRADPDDLLVPTRIEKQVMTLETNPDIDVLGCNFTNIHEETKKALISSNFPTEYSEIKQRYQDGGHGLAHGTVCGKASVFKAYQYQNIFPGEDYELFSRMVKDGRILKNLKDILYLVRVHPKSSTSNIKLSDIKQTFAFRDKIFEKKTSCLTIRIHYLFIKNYRCFQLETNPIKKTWCLLCASLLAPRRILNRLR